tara:strand:+ start:361 stop:1857 length:1497 start_codon:yes stop_codon:yes gene_type:complete
MSEKQPHNFKSLPDDGSAHVMTDGWMNLLTGIGVKGKDKSMSGTVVHDGLIQTIAEELYSADDIAQRIVDRIPKDGVREWIKFKNLDKDIESRLNDVIKRLDLKTKILDAWVSARLYGGAGLFISISESVNGDKTEALSKEIKKTGIRSVKSLTLLNKYELISGGVITSDLESKNFGLPENYTMTPQKNVDKQLNLHHSRVIRFDGQKLPTQKFIANDYWDDSVLSKIYQIISSFNQSYTASSDMLLDFRVAVIKLKNLFQMIAQGDEKKVKDRMELIKMQKSVINMVLLNEGEEFEHKTHSLTGVKDILDKIDNRLVAASGLPRTILLGESPSGLGATGNSELRNYYDDVAQEQESKIRRPLDEIFRYIFLSKDGPTNGKYPEDFGFEFVPLWQMTEGDKAKMEYDVAKKDEVYIANGVLDPDEVAVSRYGGQGFSQDTKINSERLIEAIERNSAQSFETPKENGNVFDKLDGGNRTWDKIKAIFKNDHTDQTVNRR